MDLNKIKSFVLLALFFSITFSLPSYSQDIVKQKHLFRKALADFNDLKYVDAIKNLTIVLEREPDNVAAQELIAASYRNVRNYGETMTWYGKLVEHQSIKPEWALHFAQALASNGRYEESELWYRKYYELVPTDQRAGAFANTKMDKLLKRSSPWDVYFTNLNTQNAEYSPIYYKNGLLFSSNRSSKGIRKYIFSWDYTPFTDLFIIDSLKNIKNIDEDREAFFNEEIGNPEYRLNDDDTAPTSNDNRTIVRPTARELTVRTSDELSVKPVGGRVNTRFHEGPSALLPDGSLIFTRNNYNAGRKGSSSEGVTKLKLFTAKGSEWNKIEEFPYNNNEFSVGHPTVSREGDILIFASDLPGGFGGTDLYYTVRIKNGRWGRPVNLGKRINTEGDELFPYLDNRGKLYFSSNGHAGFGGLDLFEVDFKDLKVQTKPVNLGTPVNSSKDDFGIIKSADGTEGFMSSNRKGTDDIYRLIKRNYNISLQGVILDDKSGLPLSNSKIVIFHPGGNDTIFTDLKGRFTRGADKDIDYELYASKERYVSRSQTVSTRGIRKDSLITITLRLPKPDLSQSWVMKNCDSLKRTFFTKDIYYDLDKSQIREDAKPVLQKLAEQMKNYLEMNVITASHCDTRASAAYNKNLSLRRGQSVRTYLQSLGIDPKRVQVEFFGKSKLLNRCVDGVPCSEADQQLNRRTEFQIILNGVNLSLIDCNN